MHGSDTIIVGNVTVILSARTVGLDMGYSITVPSDLDDRGVMVEEMLRLGRESMALQMRELDASGSVGRPATTAIPGDEMKEVGLEAQPTKEEDCDGAGR